MRVATKVGTVVATAAFGVMSFGTAALASPGNNGTPSENTFILNCGALGAVTVAAPPGHNARPGFVDGAVYEALSVTFTQDSTGAVLSSKTYGQTNGGGTPITCTASAEGVTTTVVVVAMGPAAR